ncbi:hypothetical protein Mboo_0723 [Methanoregula boonei 6A8]|uniref:Uncharacterized protein n=1 Tax=Methanoregula boonei (strain DSM 21154 / JCM 14090 / 6A8) TaxID=456442 RepID=A7I680_METB6|nr:hypothetical protein Mboo_0723 [Methanoregula boonei 6A8]
MELCSTCTRYPFFRGLYAGNTAPASQKNPDFPDFSKLAEVQWKSVYLVNWYSVVVLFPKFSHFTFVVKTPLTSLPQQIQALFLTIRKIIRLFTGSKRAKNKSCISEYPFQISSIYS